MTSKSVESDPFYRAMLEIELMWVRGDIRDGLSKRLCQASAPTRSNFHRLANASIVTCDAYM